MSEVLEVCCLFFSTFVVGPAEGGGGGGGDNRKTFEPQYYWGERVPCKLWGVSHILPVDKIRALGVACMLSAPGVIA